jgi:hypothetical protein
MREYSCTPALLGLGLLESSYALGDRAECSNVVKVINSWNTYFPSVIPMSTDLQEDFKNLLKFLSAMSPAYNRLVQMLFLLPQRAKVFMLMYPEVMEREDEIFEFFSLEYDSKGFIKHSSYGFGYYLVSIYHSLFRRLMEANERKRLLQLAGITEEEFKEFDPLRAWIYVSLDYLAKANRDALKLLDVVITKLSGKRPGDYYISWDEIREATPDIKNFEDLMELLRKFYLIRYEYTSRIYVRECPLLLDVYSDLRDKLKKLLG